MITETKSVLGRCGETLDLMEHAMKRLSLASICLITSLSGCISAQERQFIAAVKGKPAADFTLTSLNGEDVHLNQFRGKPVVLAFWAST